MLGGLADDILQGGSGRLALGMALFRNASNLAGKPGPRGLIDSAGAGREFCPVSAKASGIDAALSALDVGGEKKSKMQPGRCSIIGQFVCSAIVLWDGATLI